MRNTNNDDFDHEKIKQGVNHCLIHAAHVPHLLRGLLSSGAGLEHCHLQRTHLCVDNMKKCQESSSDSTGKQGVGDPLQQWHSARPAVGIKTREEQQPPPSPVRIFLVRPSVALHRYRCPAVLRLAWPHVSSTEGKRTP